VKVRDAGGVVAEYRIVGVDEADGAAHRISWQSPLAKALLNARRSEQVNVKTPAGIQELEIVDITNES
jgi:transcription elongation factor GreB